MSKIKISGHQLQKLQTQADNLKAEIANDKVQIEAKEKELQILNEAIANLQKLSREKAE